MSTKIFCDVIFSTRYEEYMAKDYKEYGDKNSREIINDRIKKFAEHLR